MEKCGYGRVMKNTKGLHASLTSMVLEVCKHGSSAPASMLDSLPETQVVRTGRHRCCVCSYQKGFEDAQLGSPLFLEMQDCRHGSSAPLSVLKNLPQSQAGRGRHKCATCAYKNGYEAGLVEKGFLDSLISKKTKGELHIVQPPSFIKSTKVSRPSFKGRKTHDRSYREYKNELLGRAGELLVICYEYQSLVYEGRKDLANKIIHVSEEEGDGAGYDIKSYQPNGKVKYIEVKTTHGPVSTSFFVTYTELEFSKQNSADYYLYRVCDFNATTNSGNCYIIQGNIDFQFNLFPTAYRASRLP